MTFQIMFVVDENHEALQYRSSPFSS
jgi:hypothetical protein